MTNDVAEAYFQGDSRTNRQRMLAGDFYIADDPDNERIARQGALLADAYYRAFLNDPESAKPLLERLLGSVGQRSVVKPPLFVDYGENLHIGDDVFVNFNLTALDVAAIRIGDHCMIGPNVQLLTPIHPIEPTLRAAGLESAQPITLENNVWLGGGVIVCPGVTIGENSVIGAGSVVTKDIPANSVAVGNPARVIRSVCDESPTSPIVAKKEG